MRKCKRCGKIGFFLKLDADGLCAACQTYYEDLSLRLTAMRLDAEADRAARIQANELKRAEYLNTFRASFFPIVSPDPTIQKIWSQWPESLHDSDEQLGKQLKAKFEWAPVLIQKKYCYGVYINGISSEVRKCNLTTCSCPEFIKTKKPCVHIYRLFSDLLGVDSIHPEILENDYHSKFLSLDDDCKIDFLKRIAYLSEKGRDVFLNKALSSQVEAGLFSISKAESYEPLLVKMTKDEMILALAKKSVQGYRPSWSKVKLIDWIINEQPSFLERIFPNFVHISASKDLLCWRNAIEKYRKECSYVHPVRWQKAVDSE